MGDKLDKAIQEKRSYVEALEVRLSETQRALDIAKAELAAFEAAANLRPTGDVQKRKGRQPGAISDHWKQVLRAVFLFGNSSYNQIHEFANAIGGPIDLPAVRERVRSFVKAGLLSGDTDVGFEVTQEAIKRFGFDSPIAARAPAVLAQATPPDDEDLIFD